MASLDELIEAAAAASEPGVVAKPGIALGGIDPLGMRQVNFDLMDKVFPGINNAANHIRPFAVVTWAWRRAGQIAKEQGKSAIPMSVLEDFVARIEVLFAWSQFLRKRDADLPGRDVLAPLLELDSFTFHGDKWKKIRDGRTYSTALSAPVNYGPAIKTFQWLQPAPDGSGALEPTELVEPVLAAMDKAMESHLKHPAFASFGKVTVQAEDVAAWGEAWALDRLSRAEKQMMIEAMTGGTAPPARRKGVALALAAYAHLGGDASFDEIRRAMCGAPTDFVPPPDLRDVSRAWRAVQVRQTFRLAMEALLGWVFWRVEEAGAASTDVLVQEFLAAVGGDGTTAAWLDEALDPSTGPIEWLLALSESMYSEEWPVEIPRAIRTALAHCFAEAPDNPGLERLDRLPIARAAKEAAGWRNEPVAAFVTHMFDAWVFGQHVYWAVGRGLGDARAGARVLLRLKVSLEENGWMPMPGARMSVPSATLDRLGTMLSLMSEAGMLGNKAFG